MTDGRHIDPELGALGAEAAQQRTTGQERPGEVGVWRGDVAGESATYFERPLLKQPVWIWSVPVYFYVGGAAGAAATLGLAAQAVDRDGLADLVARCRWLTAGGTAVGSLLLIIDLGRPERFLNMLRVFRPTSALNLGSWVLALSGSSSGLAALTARRNGFLGRMGDAAGATAGVLGLPLAGYTAVLLADTAVPVWRATRRSLPWLFVASSAEGAATFLEAGSRSTREKAIASRFGAVARVAHLAAAARVARDAASHERVGRALTEGLAGSLWRASLAATIAGLAASGLRRGGRAKAGIETVLGVTAGLSLRFAVFHAGKASAADPRATTEPQRAGLEESD